MTRITTIVNLHREGRICEATLDSVLNAGARAEAAGHACEILMVIDDGDAETEAAIEPYLDRARLERCRVRDPGAARNFAVERASGDYIALMDGDDLMGFDWLVIAAAAAERASAREVVLHPRENYVFGRDLKPEIWLHPDMDEDRIDVSFLRVANMWTPSSTFAKAEIFRRFKFCRSEIERGLGFEDWVWNFETVSAGVVHLAPPGTIQFVRRKAVGSVLARSDLKRIIPNFALD